MMMMMMIIVIIIVIIITIPQNAMKTTTNIYCRVRNRLQEEAVRRCFSKWVFL